jgi:hypothetical protein
VAEPRCCSKLNSRAPFREREKDGNIDRSAQAIALANAINDLTGGTVARVTRNDTVTLEIGAGGDASPLIEALSAMAEVPRQ